MPGEIHWTRLAVKSINVGARLSGAIKSSKVGSVSDFSKANRAEGVEGGDEHCEIESSSKSKSLNSRHSVIVNCMIEFVPMFVGSFL